MEDGVPCSDIDIERRAHRGSHEEADDHSCEQYQGLPPRPRWFIGLAAGHAK